MTESRLRTRFLDCSGLTIQQAESFGRELAYLQRDIMFWIGDLARYSEARWPDTHQQVWPEWVSPGMLARAAGVCRAYPREEDRQQKATYSQYMQVAGRGDRLERLRAIVEKGLTTDESRQAGQQEQPPDNRPGWLLAFDIHYFTHRHFFSGAGVETAHQVAEWVKRTVDRLKEKGATDVLCAFEGVGSFRKALTAGPDWAEHRYKDRPPKPSDLTHQLRLVRELLEGYGYACVSVDQYEADDVLASAAKQFPGKVTIISSDKDLRQCLSERVNMLLDVEWVEDDTSGDLLPEYNWLSASNHTEATGIIPNKWATYQMIMGDSVDGIQGVEGIGEKGAWELIREFGSVEAAIQAAKRNDERIKPKKRQALIAFEHRLDVTRQLVTLCDQLPVLTSTRI